MAGVHRHAQPVREPPVTVHYEGDVLWERSSRQHAARSSLQSVHRARVQHPQPLGDPLSHGHVGYRSIDDRVRDCHVLSRQLWITGNYKCYACSPDTGQWCRDTGQVHLLGHLPPTAVLLLGELVTQSTVLQCTP